MIEPSLLEVLVEGAKDLDEWAKALGISTLINTMVLVPAGIITFGAYKLIRYYQQKK